MKVYSITHATTHGVVEVDDVSYSEDSPEYVCKKDGDVAKIYFEKLERDVFLTKKEAAFAAAMKINRKIASYEKKILKLRGLAKEAAVLCNG